MWCQSGFQPDSFWDQTPATFQACMRGVRDRLEGEAEDRIGLAYHTAAFTARSQVKPGLKPLNSYLKKPPRVMGNKEMLANMQIMAARVNKKFEGKA